MLNVTRVVGRQVGLEARRAVRVGAGELAGLSVERGREEHRLAILRQAANDPVDLRLEAHVEHPVGLVEDEGLDTREVDELTLREVLETSRSGNEDLGALDALRLGSER